MKPVKRLLSCNFNKGRINLFHRPCLLCNNSGELGMDMCMACKADLPWIESSCRGCGLPLPENANALQCGECLSHQTPFTLAITPLYYRKPLSHLINGFKHHNQLVAGKLLGQLLAQEIRDHYLDDALPEAILPVPLHWQRFLWRGYNQAHELGKQLSREINIPCDNNFLRRIRSTSSQQGLSREERLHNLKGAFRIHKKIPFKRVAILDDVVTTGATVGELGNLLSLHGVEEVHLWAIARTPSRT